MSTPGSRGPAPPLPEKPPSVAERTRLLRSSFRKEEVEKPKVTDNRSATSGSTASVSPVSERSSGTFTNGERSPSPVQSKNQGNDSSANSVGYTSNRFPSQPEKPVPVTSFTQDSNKETATKLVPGTNLNAAKRDAFFRSGGSDGPTAKFDPSTRFPPDREKTKQDKEREFESDKEKKEREKEVVRTNDGGQYRTLDGYVGFANLPNQVYRKSVKRGFDFTLMVVGESGLGKSTLINSLFVTDLYCQEYVGPSHRIKKTVSVETTNVVIKENGVTLRLTIVDTPGFGDAVDNSNCWQPVTDFIDSKYEEFLNAESRVSREPIIPDHRVHTCLYFISPTSHGLKPLDVEFMKRLHDKVNIVPLIAKADTLTPDECRDFKKTILNEIAQHRIKIYEFPDTDDDDENKQSIKMKDRVPFAVVGSNRVLDVGGKRVRGRQYPWGIVEVENLEHNDFVALRNMVIRTHMQDLKDVTNNVHYENYRYGKLAPVGGDGKVKPGSLNRDPLSQMAEEKKEHELKMKKMESEMEQVFESKVKEKKQKLKDSEADLQKRAEQMKKNLEQQQKELDDKWKTFEKERQAWEEQFGERRRSLDKDAKKNKKGLF
ncbi:septin-7-like isoform X2 [Gigantopelta aegis]|uniref:septin-7-like isoform X2 n=1 Tax=Gigantopelta aegis TaxID=1735272 RepID=UPI001B88931F|nr:septin-7-like isoform X2 [Gigantopelta aegis]